jgi:hypothetical protein
MDERRPQVARGEVLVGCPGVVRQPLRGIEKPPVRPPQMLDGEA